jgi:predicted membrane protein
MKDLGSLLTFILILLLVVAVFWGAVGFYISWLLTSSIVSGTFGGAVAIGLFLMVFRFMSRIQ